jgi:hypothetical protein
VKTSYTKKLARQILAYNLTFSTWFNIRFNSFFNRCTLLQFLFNNIIQHIWCNTKTCANNRHVNNHIYAISCWIWSTCSVFDDMNWMVQCVKIKSPPSTLSNSGCKASFPILLNTRIDVWKLQNLIYGAQFIFLTASVLLWFVQFTCTMSLGTVSRLPEVCSIWCKNASYPVVVVMASIVWKWKFKSRLMNLH